MTDNSNQRKTHWEKKIDDCKKRHRPCLKNWSRDQFALQRKPDFDKLKSLHLNKPQIGYIDAFKNSVDEFRNSYEKNSIPCIIKNVPAKENWSSVTNWTPNLLKENYRHRLFKCGEDDDGYKVKIKMKYFIKYMKDNVDDSPLYIFDSNYDDDSVSKSLLKDYKVPDYFPEDLFSLVGEDRRPPYRWFLVGPERSGTTVHLDPLGTSAWNTLIKGRKRWVLFPPDTDKNIAKGKDVIIKGEDDESVNYFVDLLPRIKEKHKDLQIMEVIQEEGETIFVPSGWWHGVLNLTDTIAITQNYCSSLNFDEVWTATRSGRKKMSVKWLRKLRKNHPELALRAEELNEKDGFKMHQSKKSKKRSCSSDSDCTSKEPTKKKSKMN